MADSTYALAAAELWFGDGRGTDAFLALDCRAGVGAGLVFHGEILSQERPGTGSIGQWPCPDWLLPERLGDVLSPHAPLRELVRPLGLLRTYHQLRGGKRPTGADAGGWLTEFEEAWFADEPEAQVVGRAAAAALGWSTARIHDLFAPELVILSYPLTRLGEPFVDAIRQTLAQYIHGACPRVVCSSLQQYAGAQGAAAVALHHWQPQA